MKRFLIIIIAVGLFSSGCSIYTFNPKGKSSISSIAINRFENSTAEFGLEDIMTDLIKDAFIADGNLNVVEEKFAEAVLSGTLVNYVRQPYNPDQNDRVEKYSIRMYFDIKLLNPQTDSIIWKAQINQMGIYELETETEETGQLLAIDLLVEDIINRTTKSW